MRHKLGEALRRLARRVDPGPVWFERIGPRFFEISIDPNAGDLTFDPVVTFMKRDPP